MRLIATLILLPVPVLLASCAPPSVDGCVGWEKITGTAEAVDWLAAHDPGMLTGIIGHAEFGAAQGCWE